MSAPVRVLITGFGPYPGVPRNPSQWLAELVGRDRPPGVGVELAWAVLPVTWGEAAERARACLEAFRPHAVVHFGFAPGTHSIRVETRARNGAVAAPDARGLMAPAPYVVPGGSPRLDATLASPLLAEALRRENVKARLSRDAGGYLCNYVLYRSLHWAAGQEANGQRPPLVGFFHIPPVGHLNGASLAAGVETLAAGGRIIVRCAASLARWEHRRGKRPWTGGSCWAPG